MHAWLCVSWPPVLSRKPRPTLVWPIPALKPLVRLYLDEHHAQVNEACIAIACPINGDWVAMTNHSWEFSISEMQSNLGLDRLQVIN